jgi:carbamoyl-phosphate synthase large subunit
VGSDAILKIHEGRPNIGDAIKDGQIQLVINTPSGKMSVTDDSYIRKTAIRHGVPYITTLTAALATVEGIASCHRQDTGVKALQDYHADM